MKVKDVLRISVLIVIATLLITGERGPSIEDHSLEDREDYFLEDREAIWESERLVPQLPSIRLEFPQPTDNFRYLENRSFTDRPDDFPGEQIHAIFVLPLGGEDDQLDTSGAIAVSMESIQLWMENQTGGQRFRFDTYQGMLDVTFLNISRESIKEQDERIDPWQEIVDEVLEAGFNNPDKLYAIHYLGWGSACGMGQLESWGIAYLESCRYDKEFNLISGITMAHEILHAVGAVPKCAPNTASVYKHVLDSQTDIMYDGPATSPIVLDYGRDDYYGHGRDDCLDIAKSPFLTPMPGNQTT